MERSQAQSMIQRPAGFTPIQRCLIQGLRRSGQCLTVGAALLAMEAPVLAQLADEVEAPAAETELIEALAAPLAEAQSLDATSEAAVNDELEALAEVMAGQVVGDELSNRTANEPLSDELAAEVELNQLSEAEPEALPEEQVVVETLETGDSTQAVESAPETGADETAVDEAIADSPSVNEPNIAEDIADAESESDEVASEELPIPSLGDRCAAPEATLFPPEPTTEDATAEDNIEGDTAEAGSKVESESAAADDVPEEIAAAETTAEDSSEEIALDEIASEKEATSEEVTEEVAIVEPDTDIEDLDQEAKTEAAAKAAEEKELICALHKADQQYQAGELAQAKVTYQLAKDPFSATKSVGIAQKPAITDPEELSAGGRVFLREAAAGREQNLETKVLVPLNLLTEQHPEFIPGQVQLAEALVEAGRAEEALALLEEASGRYPNEPDLLKAHIGLASDEGQWMDAVMTARRFAQLNPDHPRAEEFVALAEENMALFQSDTRDRLRANTIANVLTGAVSVALTGSIWNSLSSIQTTAMMLRGEAGVGNGISKSIKRQVELVEDEELVNYVQTMGDELAAVAGRDEFDYEFNILMDPNLNAFALPGGKIFVNAGAIAQTRSKAELAGLLSHEIAHAVLSHGFRLVSDGSLLSDLSRFVPYGGYASNLVVLNYSRSMEREADELGTRIAASAGYAADGLHGLMKTLDEQDRRGPMFAWMSTHPETDERVENLEVQISRENLERYQFEGVEEHFRMRVKVKRLIEDWKERKAKEAKERPWWR